MKKKIAALLLAAVMVMTGLSACGSGTNNNSGDKKGQEKEDNKEIEQEEDPADKVYVIGISQFAEHGSLDNCREGFLEGLRQEGISEEDGNLEIKYDNAQTDTATANQIAQSYVADKVDLICAVATISAQSAFNAAADSDIPVIYTAVTDPVSAELANEDGTSTGNVTGTSDKLAVEAQLAMIREILPEAKTIGILYTTSEVNSESALAEYEAAVKEYGFELVSKGISTTADIPLAADAILEEVDCLNNLTDNTVVNALPTILDKANAKGIPVFGSEIEQVKKGCLAAEGLDYMELGIVTGKMAAKVLKGEIAAEDIPYEVIEESGVYLNTEAADKLGITFGEEVTERAAEIFDVVE